MAIGLKRDRCDAIVFAACVEMPSLAANPEVEARFDLPVVPGAVASTNDVVTSLGRSTVVPGAWSARAWPVDRPTGRDRGTSSPTSPSSARSVLAPSRHGMHHAAVPSHEVALACNSWLASISRSSVDCGREPCGLFDVYVG
jgi:hypothetical protein